MTINIEYETDKTLDLAYEKITNGMIAEAALDYEKCPYEAEVNVILTDNDAIQEINREYRQIDASDGCACPSQWLTYEKPSDFEPCGGCSGGLFQSGDRRTDAGGHL